MKTVSLKLPAELHSRLAAMARKRKTTKSELVRVALQRYFEAAGRERKGSFLDVAGDLVGSLSGPGDLSYNRKRMRGYGR